MEEKIDLSLFEEFFELSWPADYSKMLINTKNADENKEIVAKIKNKISDLKDNIREMSKTEEKVWMRHWRLLKKLLITIKMLKKIFHLHQKLIKENQN